MTTIAVPLGPGRLRRWADHAVLILLITALLLLAALGFATALRYRTLVVRSDSMAPAISAGDIVVSRPIHPADADIGEVVTFRDATRSEELVTHRIVKVRHRGERYAFVTKGDANTGVERWSIPARGDLGQHALRIPKAGYVVGWVSAPGVRTGLLVAAAAVIAALALRSIWARAPIRPPAGRGADLLFPAAGSAGSRGGVSSIPPAVPG